MVNITQGSSFAGAITATSSNITRFVLDHGLLIETMYAASQLWIEDKILVHKTRLAVGGELHWSSHKHPVGKPGTVQPLITFSPKILNSSFLTMILSNSLSLLIGLTILQGVAASPSQPRSGESGPFPEKDIVPVEALWTRARDHFGVRNTGDPPALIARHTNHGEVEKRWFGVVRGIYSPTMPSSTTLTSGISMGIAGCVTSSS